MLAEIGVDTEGLRSKGLTEINLQDYCLLINLSEYSLNRVLPPESADRLIRRPMPDPFGGSLEEYRRSLDAIKHHDPTGTLPGGCASFLANRGIKGAARAAVNSKGNVVEGLFRSLQPPPEKPQKEAGALQKA